MKKRKRINWTTVKVCMINWTLFTLIAASVAMWLLIQDRKELMKENIEVEHKLETCERNFEEWSKQVKSGKIILNLETEK